MKKRDWYKRLWISLTLILLIGLLTGCNTAVEHNTNDTKTDHEKKQTLQEELDALVSQLALENTVGEMIDVSQNADIDKFPDELVRRMQEALVAGTSDTLLEELDDSGLRISREDFDYEPREGGELSYEEERVNTVFADRSKTASYDFYQLDMDQDGLDEIIMMEHTQYEFSGSSGTIVLEQNDAGSYMFAGDALAGYYRLYAIFSYEGTYYMICNYDDYKKETTKALGLFDLSGESRGLAWQIGQEHIYLRRSSTDCEIESLWTTEQDSVHTEAPDLQSSMWTYIREIGLDLMLRNQNSESFQGAEKGLSEQEQDRLTAALDDASWTPAHLGYAPQEQKWLFMLEEQPVYFALYYKEQPDRYLVEAFLYKEDSEKSVLEPIALYEIKPQIRVVADDYWNHEDRNVETICYQSEDASLAFPENWKEVAAQLLQQVQGEFQPASEQSAEDIVPDELVLLAQKALFTRDWSSLDALAAPLELTDHEAVYGTWFTTMDLDDIQRYVCHIFQYKIENSQFLIVVRDSGGSARIADIYCYRLAEDGPEYIDQVPTLDMGARVVPYEGGFYLVNICYNYYSKYTDTIYLYPLTLEGISEQAIEVTLLPTDYIWTKGYQSNVPVLEQINSYVESVQRELMEASPINDNITVFTGCEEPVTDPVKLQRLSNSRAWYNMVVVDYDNDGRLEYQGRYHWFPSNSTTLYLITEEYHLEDITLELQEKWEPECPYRSSYELIQRWYQEFDGKIYTFQLFLTEGYNYYLNVSLWEGEHISWIASYYVTPRCELQTQIVGQETTGMG